MLEPNMRTGSINPCFPRLYSTTSLYRHVSYLVPAPAGSMASRLFLLPLYISHILLFLFPSSHEAATTTVARLAQNASNAAPQRAFIRSPDWVGNVYVASDCEQALWRLVRDEVLVHGDKEFEFLAPNTAPFHTLPTMQTPRRYTVGKSMA